MDAQIFISLAIAEIAQESENPVRCAAEGAWRQGIVLAMTHPEWAQAWMLKEEPEQIDEEKEVSEVIVNKFPMDAIT